MNEVQLFPHMCSGCGHPKTLEFWVPMTSEAIAHNSERPICASCGIRLPDPYDLACDQFYSAARDGQWVYSNDAEANCVYRKGSKHDAESPSYDPIEAQDDCDWLFASSEWSYVNQQIIRGLLTMLNEADSRTRANGE